MYMYMCMKLIMNFGLYISRLQIEKLKIQATGHQSGNWPIRSKQPSAK